MAISEPVRGRRLLQAVRQSNGTCITVSEDEISSAQVDLARKGIYIEPTSAVAVAALEHLRREIQEDDIVVVPLTGSGLKGSPILKKKQ